MDDSQVYVLPKLTDIFQQSDSEEISRELKLLHTQCQNIVDSEINRVSECSEKIEVCQCEFSKIQFPKSQCQRSHSKIPVRY